MFPELSAALGPIYFYLFAGVAVICGLLMLVARHPIQGAVSLIGVMLSLAGLYAILHSPFIAVLQVLVYAGAVMMLLVFVIMVLNHGQDHRLPRFDALSLVSLVLPLLVGAIVISTVTSSPTLLDENTGAARGGIEALAAEMFRTDAGATGWWILFEIGGALLLAAVVGAVLLAKRSLDTPIDDHGDHAGHAERASARATIADDAAAGRTTVTAAAPVTETAN